MHCVTCVVYLLVVVYFGYSLHYVGRVHVESMLTRLLKSLRRLVWELTDLLIQSISIAQGICAVGNSNLASMDIHGRYWLQCTMR